MKLTNLDNDVLPAKEASLAQGLVRHVMGHDGGAVCKLVSIQTFHRMGHYHNTRGAQNSGSDKIALIAAVALC